MSIVKSITPQAPADFTPEVGSYNSLKPFKYWCQKVLPLVYDDSLSYYELLCKVVDYLNKVLSDTNTLANDVSALHDAYVKLQEYVNTYFSSLDVQEEINNKLDTMVEDGTLEKIFGGTIKLWDNSFNSSQINMNKVSSYNRANSQALCVINNYIVTGGSTESGTQFDVFSLTGEYMKSFTFNDFKYHVNSLDYDGKRIFFTGKNDTDYSVIGNLTIPADFPSSEPTDFMEFEPPYPIWSFCHFTTDQNIKCYIGIIANSATAVIFVPSANGKYNTLKYFTLNNFGGITQDVHCDTSYFYVLYGDRVTDKWGDNYVGVYGIADGQLIGVCGLNNKGVEMEGLYLYEKNDKVNIISSDYNSNLYFGMLTTGFAKCSYVPSIRNQYARFELTNLYTSYNGSEVYSDKLTSFVTQFDLNPYVLNTNMSFVIGYYRFNNANHNIAYNPFTHSITIEFTEVRTSDKEYTISYHIEYSISSTTLYYRYKLYKFTAMSTYDNTKYSSIDDLVDAGYSLSQGYIGALIGFSFGSCTTTQFSI